MTTQMVRKQIYIPQRLNLMLKRLSKARGISEAEIIREALEQSASAAENTISDSDAAWKEILRLVDERKKAFAGQGEPVRWNREEIYEERENRWLKPRPE